MDAPKTGPTLEGLAERMEALERENEQLRGKVATLEGSATTHEEKPDTDGIGEPLVVEGRVSRKAMLAKAGAAAVAAVGAGVLLSPREAKAAQVVGDGQIGVRGIGTTNPSAGVRGEIEAGKTGDGVQGFGAGVRNIGVYGKNLDTDGTGVKADGDLYGVDATGNYYGVAAISNNYGVYADGPTAVYAYGNNYGVHAIGSTGVYGIGTTAQGYGGIFEGGKAQLKLNPKSTQGRPSSGSHQKGEIYLDSAGTVFVCTKGGTPGTWRKLSSTPA